MARGEQALEGKGEKRRGVFCHARIINYDAWGEGGRMNQEAKEARLKRTGRRLRGRGWERAKAGEGHVIKRENL